MQNLLDQAIEKGLISKGVITWTSRGRGPSRARQGARPTLTQLRIPSPKRFLLQVSSHGRSLGVPKSEYDTNTGSQAKVEDEQLGITKRYLGCGFGLAIWAFIRGLLGPYRPAAVSKFADLQPDAADLNS